MGLKWDMSERLREDFYLRNPDKEHLNYGERLNYEFAVAALGIKIYSYVETKDTQLNVLSTIDTSGESVVDVGMCIVDSRSAKLSSADVPVEEEDVIELNCTHTGIPRFTKEDTLKEFLVDELVSFAESFSIEDRAIYDELNASIMKEVKVEVHQFYQTGAKGDLASTKILTGRPSLKDFFEDGPSRSLERRLDKAGVQERTKANGSNKPAIRIRHPSEPEQPIIKLDRAASDGPKKENSDKNTRRSSVPTLSLFAPAVEMPESIHTRRPPTSMYTRRPSLTVEPNDILPRKPSGVKFSGIPEDDVESPTSPRQNIAYLDNERINRPQRSYTYQLPSRSSNLFKWVRGLGSIIVASCEFARPLQDMT